MSALTRRTCLQSMLGGLAALSRPASAQSRRPNVVFIVSDDHGYGDVGFHEHPKEVATPNIDRIVRRGVRFSQGYAAAYVCAPSRAAILTGTYSQRYGFYTASDSRAGLPLTQVTLADVLRKEGYATAALGKWHLGLTREYHPMSRGFDEFYGFLGHGAHDYFDLKPAGQYYHDILRNWEPVADTGYLTDNLGREAVSFIARNEKKPFFLYLAFNAVHFPMQAPEALIRKHDTGDQRRNTLMAMLEAEDVAIGKVLDELERHKLADNTLLVFVSDNGGARNNGSVNLPLRDYKHSVYEGGIRVPYVVSWPARLKPNTVCHEPVAFMDLMPTVVNAVGAKLPLDRVYEGRDFLPVVTGKAKGPLHDALFWDGAEEKTAVRAGRWKLVNNYGRVELFDLEADRSEKNDLAPQKPEIVAQLRARIDAWSKLNAARLTRGGANDEEENPSRDERKAARKAAKQGKKK